MNLSTEQYKSLARLESNNPPEWRAFKEILKEAREDARDRMEDSNDLAYIHREQGKSLILADLISCIEDSREVALKMQERNR